MINLNTYFNPSSKTIEYINKLWICYQLLNQEKVDIWFKKHKNNNSFSGTLCEFNFFHEFNSVASIKEGDVGDVFLKAILLSNSFSTIKDLKLFAKLNNNEIIEAMQIIKEGISSQEAILKWLKPFDKEKLQAIQDALTLNIKNSFNILKIEKFDSYNSEKVSIYPYILEIESAEDLLTFLKIQKNIRNVLIVSIQRNKQYEFKNDFYLFLIYNGILYSIDTSDRRLNLNNIEGCRNPDRHLERKYEKIWLPINLLFEDKKISESKTLIRYNSRIKNIISWEEISKENSSTLYWLYCFLERLVEYVDKEEIEIGVSKKDLPKLLIYENNKKSVPLCENYGTGSYLEKIYANKCKDVVLLEENLPSIVGNEKYVKNVIAYEKRKLLAKKIQDLVNADFKKNNEKVYSVIKEFVKSFPIEKLVTKALQDREYSYRHYEHFSDGKKEGLYKQKIMKISEYCWFDHNGPIAPLNEKNFCAIDKKNKRKKFIELEFIDYHQFLEFFEILPKDIPLEMIQHLHQQSEKYVGNSILEDIDPIDLLKDPWFKSEKYLHGIPNFKIIIPICNRCIKKINNKILKEK